VSSSILMALASTLSLEDLIAKCNMIFLSYKKTSRLSIKVFEDRMKAMEKR
jgi:hypothetical protein